MSYSNETETLKLPQYSAEDKPTWLVDVNESFAKIDVFAKNTNEEIENIHTHEQETANTLESIARTLESQSDTNTDIERRVKKHTEDLTLLTTHVNEHDESLNAIESEINGLSAEVENKAEKTEVETLQGNLVSANNAINALEESENDFEFIAQKEYSMSFAGPGGGTFKVNGCRIKNILILSINTIKLRLSTGTTMGLGRIHLSDLITSAKYSDIEDFTQKDYYVDANNSALRLIKDSAATLELEFYANPSSQGLNNYTTFILKLV